MRKKEKPKKNWNQEDQDDSWRPRRSKKSNKVKYKHKRAWLDQLRQEG